jgi:Protein of unknown function (DUF2889)
VRLVPPRRGGILPVMAGNTTLPKAPRQSAGFAPPRRAASARRTSSIDTSWPDGQMGAMHMVGRARDIVTPRSGGAPVVCAEDGFVATVRADRSIAAIDAQPPRTDLSRLVGVRGGGKLRHALEEIIPEERRNATPLYLILDDIAGSSLVAGWAWSQWDPNWLMSRRVALNPEDFARMMREREGVCTGFAPGSTALDPDPALIADRTGTTPTTELRHPQDPDGWHAFTVQDSVGMRRARRVDVWIDEVVVVEAAFQDSAATPDGKRAALHEYNLSATVDPHTMRLLTIDATPRVLPFPECPGAVANLPKLLGADISSLRQRVLDELPGTLGCTHLNDALRSLAEVPALVGYLRRSIEAA